MGESTSIQWCDATFNPWIGCQRVSPGCEHCYAEVQDQRWRKPDARRWGPKALRERTSVANWKKPIQWNKRAATLGVRERVFCSSLADVFEDRPELAPWRADLFKLIDATPALDWLLLTKRPENADGAMHQAARDAFPGRTGNDLVVWPANVWLGTTVEDQRRAEERIPALLATDAVLKFLSVEPQLEAIDLAAIDLLRTARTGGDPRCHLNALTGVVAGPGDQLGRIGWVIQGGESGAGARPFDPEWARSMAAQCKQAGVAYFLKQLGAKPVGLKLKDGHGGDMAEWPKDLQQLGRAFPVVTP